MSLFVFTIQVVRRSVIALGRRLRGLTLFRGPCTTAHCSRARETRCPDGFPVTRFMLFEQAVAYQKRDAARANLDRRNHGYAP